MPQVVAHANQLIHHIRRIPSDRLGVYAAHFPSQLFLHRILLQEEETQAIAAVHLLPLHSHH